MCFVSSATLSALRQLDGPLPRRWTTAGVPVCHPANNCLMARSHGYPAHGRPLVEGVQTRRAAVRVARAAHRLLELRASAIHLPCAAILSPLRPVARFPRHSLTPNGATHSGSCHHRHRHRRVLRHCYHRCQRHRHRCRRHRPSRQRRLLHHRGRRRHLLHH